MIRIPQVRVVDEEGAQLGVMPTAQALAMAQERGYDLVEVAPMAAPPVARFLDFGQYKYELTKREKEAKRKQRSVTFKEVRLKPKIGGGDFDTKVRRAIEFLEEGDRIKVAVQFRGRELTHPEIGRALIERFTDRIKDHGVVERAPLLEGKSMHITVASTHKPTSHDGPPAAGSSAVPREPSPAPAGPAIEAVAATAEPAASTAEPDGREPVGAPVTAVDGAPAAAPRATPRPRTRSAPAATPAPTGE
ncbi:MAG: translation initiation factor IF-3 [Chloroflexi bacterium]|nr:translation initiation factor IF-3 [Chloroflexota bacterium]